MPAKCIFENELDVTHFQSGINSQTETHRRHADHSAKTGDGSSFERESEARKKGLSITPRGGSTAGSRSFEDTFRIWNSRFYPALNYWIKRGKISREDAEAAKKMPIQQQVAQVLEWEEDGYYFSTGFNKSILYSVAAPGASQHIFMLALDVSQFGNKQVREILADHGWYQTVKSDLPHFTYLGVEESKLPALGLEAVTSGGYTFWIPRV